MRKLVEQVKNRESDDQARQAIAENLPDRALAVAPLPPILPQNARLFASPARCSGVVALSRLHPSSLTAGLLELPEWRARLEIVDKKGASLERRFAVG